MILFRRFTGTVVILEIWLDITHNFKLGSGSDPKSIPFDLTIQLLSLSNSHFYHRSLGTFFELQGALKYFCKITGDAFDDDAFGELFDDLS